MEKTKKKAKDHYLYDILHLRPNSETIAFNYYETIVAHLCLRGMHYSQIIRDKTNKIIELIPLNPANMQKTRIKDGKIKYFYIDASGKQWIFPKSEIFEVMGFSLDGFIGVSPITLQREALGLSKATEKHGAKLFSNGARPGGILEVPTELSEPAYKRLKESWTERHQGVENSNKTAILEQGAKWHQVGLSNEDSQFLETRKFQKSEICGIYRVPPHMIADLDKATFSNIEHQGIEFGSYTLNPYIIRIEQSIESQLLTKEESKNYEVMFNADGFLRGDIKSRYMAYNLGRNMGVLSANDIREKEDMNPIKNGDIYLQPLNMGEAGELPNEKES